MFLKIIFICCFFTLNLFAKAQTFYGPVSIRGSSVIGQKKLADASAILELYTTTGAMLFPRMTTAQRDALSPQAGMMIFNTTSLQMEEYNGTIWRPLGFQDPMTSAGDIIIRNISNETARLGIGLEDQVLTVDPSGVPVWADATGGPGGADTSLFPAFNLIAENADFELGDLTGWVTGGTPVASAQDTEVGNGEYSLSFNAGADGDYIETSAYPVPDALLSKNALALMRFKGGDDNLKVQVIDGGDNVILSHDLFSSPDWVDLHLSFIFPSSGTVKFRIIAGDDAPVLYADDIGIYDANRTSIKDLNEASLYGQITWPLTDNCTWVSTSVDTWANFPVDNDCTTPSGANLKGHALAPTTKIPGIRFQNLPAGQYHIVVSGNFQSWRESSTFTRVKLRVSDGTSNSNSSFFGTSMAPHSGTPASDVGGFTSQLSYNISQEDITIQIQSYVVDGGFSSIQNNPGKSELTISVYRFPLESEKAFRPSTSTIASGVKIGGTGGANFETTSSTFEKGTHVNITASEKNHFGQAVITHTAGDFGFRMPVVQPGNYKIFVNGTFVNTPVSTDTACIFNVYDGETYVGEIELYVVLANVYNVVSSFSGIISYSSIQYDKEFTIYARRRTGGGICSIQPIVVPLEIGIIPIGETVNKPVVIEQTYRQYDLTVTGTNWTTTRAVGLPYRTIDGTWRLRGNVRGNLSSPTTSLTLAIAGVLFHTVPQTGDCDDPQGRLQTVAGGTNQMISTSGSRDSFMFFFDWELDGKPDWVVGVNN